MNKKTNKAEWSIRIKLSASSYYLLKKYAEYAGLSDAACIKLFLSNQVREYDYRRESFMKSWNQRRYREIKDVEEDKDNDGAASESHNKGIRISQFLYNSLYKISRDLGVDKTYLTVNMIRMELEKFYKEYDQILAYKRNEIETVKYTGDIKMSNIVKNGLTVIAESICVNINSLVSDILMRYLIENYKEFDIEEEDFRQKYSDIYEAEYHKAARACNKDKRATKLQTGKRHGQDNQGQ